MGEKDNVNRNKVNKFGTYPENENPEEMKIWGILIFGLIGATATTYAVTHLRRTVGWLFSQLTRSQASTGARGSSFRTAFQEEARRRYNRRMQEMHEEEMERLERIRRMQKVFKERSQFNRNESWKEYGPGAYHQQFQRDDWYWKTERSHGGRYTNYDKETLRYPASYPLSHHYTVLGLDRSRKTPYTDAEIKTAFRTKAMQFHPDQNQNNKVASEAKFKQVMTSYEAIKQERKNMKS